jgi:hypothetical protein
MYAMSNIKIANKRILLALVTSASILTAPIVSGGTESDLSKLDRGCSSEGFGVQKLGPTATACGVSPEAKTEGNSGCGNSDEGGGVAKGTCGDGKTDGRGERWSCGDEKKGKWSCGDKDKPGMKKSWGKCLPKNPESGKSDVGTNESDPIVSSIARSIIETPSVQQALSEAKNRGYDFSISAEIQDSQDKNKVPLEGVDAPLAGFVGQGKDMVFTLKLAKGSEKGSGGRKNRLGGEAGIYPDAISSIREALRTETANINSLLYAAIAYSRARALGEMELDAIGQAVSYEEIKFDVGNGEADKLAEARARALQSEIDLMVVKRKLQAVNNAFIKSTGLDYRSVTVPDQDKFFRTTPMDPDFENIVRRVATQSKNTVAGAETVTVIAVDLLNTGGELMAQRFCVEAATEALQKIRERMDGGGGSEGEEARARALLLGSQRHELVALGEYAKAHSRAYPKVRVVENVHTQPSVSITGGEVKREQSDGALWIAGIGLGLLALVVYYGSVSRGDKVAENDNPNV